RMCSGRCSTRANLFSITSEELNHRDTVAQRRKTGALGMSRPNLIYCLSLCLCVAVVQTSAAQPPKGKVTYDQHVLPILRDKCLACHNPDKLKGGLDLSTFTKLIEGGASGAVVKPGDPDGSRLFALTSHKEMPYMPPEMPALAKESLDSLRAWIQGGAL